MEDFLKVLGAGIALIILAIALMGAGQISLGKHPTNVVFASQEISLGKETRQNLRHIPLNDLSVGALGNKTVTELDNVLIQKGIIRGDSQSLDFSGEGITNAFASFEIKETNNYGDLILKLNNQEIWRERVKEGMYTIELPDFKEGDNSVEISASSSGFRIWAPTTYSLGSLKLVVSSFSREEIKEFKAYNYEVDGWDFSRLILPVYESSTEGDLIVEVNGKEIYRDAPVKGLPTQVDFDKKKLQIEKGENTIIFRAEEKGSYSIKNAELITFYYSGGLDSYVSDFYVVGKNAGLLEKENIIGELEFDVRDNINADIDVYVNDEKLDYELNKGKNVIEFSNEILYSNVNDIRFSTYGKYDIKGVKLTLETNSTK
jgi:hypothetical protein